MPVFEFRVTNSTSQGTAFDLEPWGGRYTVPSRGTLRLVIESPSYPVLEWEIAEGAHALIVRDPASALVTVYDGETALLAE